MKQALSMQEIAREAGVSVSTVSRALNNHSSISPETRLRICRIAQQLGYRPNPMVGALMTQIRGRRPSTEANLACLFGQPTSMGLVQSQAEFLAGVRHATECLGYHVDLHDAGSDDFDPEQLVRVWRARNVGGIILKNFRAEREFPVPWDEFAWVASGHNDGIPALHRVGNEIYQVVSLAIKELSRRGYTRPALALPLQEPNRAGYRWPAAFVGNLMGIWSRPSLRSVFRGEWAQEPFNSWIRSYEPDVVLSLHDEPLLWLREMGVLVPEQTGFIHLAANLSGLESSGIIQDFFRGGEAAVHTLDSQLRRNERGIPALPTALTLAGRWRDGQTLLANKGGVPNVVAEGMRQIAARQRN